MDTPTPDPAPCQGGESYSSEVSGPHGGPETSHAEGLPPLSHTAGEGAGGGG